MRIIIPFFLILLLFTGCGPDKPKELTDEQLSAEQESVKNVIVQYNKAFQNKNFQPIISLLSKNVKFFGTDSAEVINSFVDFKAEMEKEWKLFQSIEYGEMVDFSVFMDKGATLASVIYGLPCVMTLNGESQRYFLRYARTLKKEDGKWLIVSGIVGKTTLGQSTTEQLEKIQVSGTN
jgi:hypothetical protein